MTIPSWLVTAALVVFVVSSMLSIGLVVQGAEIAAPLRRPAWVGRALVANFVLPPVAALALAALLPLDPAYELGLLLIAFAAGAPFLPKRDEIGGADVAVATSLMGLLMTGSIVAMPIALPALAPGLQVDPWRIASPLVVLMLSPLLFGMVVRRVAPGVAARVQPVAAKLSNVGFLCVVLLVCLKNLPSLLAVLGSGAIGVAVLFVAVLLGGAYLLGESAGEGRRLLGYATAGRNIGAALVTAEASAVEPKVIVMLIVTGVVGLALLLPIAAYARRHRIAG